MSGLVGAIAAVEKALAKWSAATDGTSAVDDYERWAIARRSAGETLAFDLTAAGGTFVGGNEVRLRLCGFTASSTAGLDGAAGNWITAARKRLEREAAS